MVTLSAEDTRRAARLIAEAYRRAVRAPDVDRLIAHWRRTAARVERTYDGSVYDYLVDLDRRRLLAAIEAALSEDGRTTLRRTLGPIDERFERATMNGRPVAIVPAADANPWFSRVPANPGPGLRADLDRMRTR